MKYHLAETMGLSPEQVYHVSLMPCYDKKLEASREDFYNSQNKSRDVDCVITPSVYLKVYARRLGVSHLLIFIFISQLNWSKCLTRTMFR